jgi:hypothetical protein
LTTDKLTRIEQKMDQILSNQEKILDAFGLSGNSRYVPNEIDALVRSTVLKFRQKQAKRGNERAQSQGS